MLLSLLLDDFSRRDSMVNATYKDLIADEEVECFAGYDDDAARLSEQVNLAECMSDDDMTLTRDHLLDNRNILHSEETQAVLIESTINHGPRAIDKKTNVNNIDYGFDGTNEMRDDEFMINVTSDLITCSYDPDSLPLNCNDCVELLCSRLLLARTVKKSSVLWIIMGTLIGLTAVLPTIEIQAMLGLLMLFTAELFGPNF